MAGAGCVGGAVVELGAADGEGVQLVHKQPESLSAPTCIQVGKLTGGIITRSLYYDHAVVLALIPCMNPGLYGEQYCCWI